jgi:hypothetical protein
MSSRQKQHIHMPRVLFPIFLLLLALGTVVACAKNTGSNTPTPTPTSQRSIPTIMIRAMDFSYKQPLTIPAGLVDITFVNNGNEPHQAQIARMNNGVTFTQFQDALKQHDPGAALGLATLFGGPNSIMPGKSQEVILNLPQGQYASICFVAGRDNVPHYMKGMIQSFVVTNPSNGIQVPPQANGEVQLRDFSYVLPSTLLPGPMTLKVTNNGQQPHEMTLIKLAPGKSIQDVIAFLSASIPAGPPPFEEAGGMAGISPGSSAWLKLNLEPGNYAALCFIPDPKTGKPHVMLGMIASFSVQ